MGPLPPDSVWFYVPNKGAASLFSALFGVLGVGMTFRAWQGGLRKFYWVELMGISWEIAGFALRAAAHDKISDVGLFAAPQSLIVLAPLWIAGGIYLVCSRMITAASGERRILYIPVRRLTPIFVTCDVVTLLVQCTGTSVAATQNWKGLMARTGSNILIGGLAAQTATLAFFILVISNFAGSRLYVGARGQAAWILGFRSAFISSVMIFVRCVYRLVEYATGIHGYLFTHEWPFYVFEATPMIIAIGVLVAIYPPHYIALKDARTKSPADAEYTPEEVELALADRSLGEA